jgi:hypothetical protein
MFKNLSKKHTPIIVLVLINLLAGLLILPGYGESVDELSQEMYAGRTIDAIQSLVSIGRLPQSFYEEQPAQGSHGPAFIVVVTLLRRLLIPAGTMLEKLNFGHYLYFIVFQVGIVSIYFLAKRWVSEMAALGTALLFNTQPILFGHALMNPKDVVFMSLMTASVALGLWMVDRGDETPSPPGGNQILEAIRSFFRQFRRADVWLAGLLLGFSSAIRISAPLTGLIVLAYIVISRKWQVLPRFFAYGLIAFGFMVICWPYLWPDPLGRLLGSLSNSANYPDVHLTLFKGILFNAKDIPVSYLPVLLAVQLTETTLLMALVGGLALVKKIRWDFVSLIVIWFVLPTLFVIFAGVHLYNNFRQLFFILPPLFVVAGLGLDWLFGKTRRQAVRYLLLFVVLFPGFYANITLHPYQYIYYNQLVGGVQGAYGNYELDYWNLAYRDAQLYLNQVAPQNANIYVVNSKHLAETYARPDLVFNAFGGKNWKNYDYIITGTDGLSDEKFSELPTVYVVAWHGVPLAYVKRP